MTIKRYDLNDITRCGIAWREMESCPTGEWVRYEDLREQAARLLAIIERAREFLKTGEEK